MSDVTAAAISFIVGAAVIVLAGTHLARAGDAIAAHTRLGSLWVGSVLVAAATSLPELTTDIAAVRRGAVDIAVGDLFGSSMANMLIVAILSLLPIGRELFRRVAVDHALYASLAIGMTSIAALGMTLRSETRLLGVAPLSWLLLAVYIVGSRAIMKHSPLARETVTTAEMSGKRDVRSVTEAKESRQPLRSAVITFALAALVILIAAPAFARSAQILARVTGIGETFVGTWLVGITTSLPEVVTSLAAVRIGAYDMAVGNLFGSNAFNMTVFPALDLASSGGPVFAVASQTHVISALIALVMMSTAVAALVYRTKGRFSLLEPTSAMMILAYVLGLALLLFESVP